MPLSAAIKKITTVCMMRYICDGTPISSIPCAPIFSTAKNRDQARLERKHRRTEKSSKGHSTGEVTTAAILGAVVGAVIAKNT